MFGYEAWQHGFLKSSYTFITLHNVSVDEMYIDRPAAVDPSFDLEVEVAATNESFPDSGYPEGPENFIEAARTRQENMFEEGNPHQAYAAATSDALNGFIGSAPEGFGLSDDTSCSGVGCQASGSGTQYSIERVVGSTSYTEEPDVTKITPEGGEQVVGTIDSPGRMNGDFGWSKDGNLIAGALASFEHNWVGTLLAYFERPSIPFDPDNSGWQLPNMVLPETEEPKQFHPVGSFDYNLRPSFYRQFNVGIAAPTEATVGIDMWDNSNSSISRIKGQEIPEGTSQLTITSIGTSPNSGVLNINPLNAPEGITITSVSSIPYGI